MTPAALGTVLIPLFVLQTPGVVKPDLSGEWVETEVAPGKAPATLSITQTPTTLTLEYDQPNGEPQRALFNLDGSATRNTIEANGKRVERVSTARWEGDRLLISTEVPASDEGAYTVRQTWYKQGQSLIEESMMIRAATGETFDRSRRVFRNQ
jgi:hypothetical protein